MSNPRKVRCPGCKAWAIWENNPYKPFCSQECRGRDLGNWATERYRIPDERSEFPGKPSSGTGEEEDEDSD